MLNKHKRKVLFSLALLSMLWMWLTPGALAAPQDSSYAELAELRNRTLSSASYKGNWSYPDTLYYYRNAQGDLCVVSVDEASSSLSVFSYDAKYAPLGTRTISFQGYPVWGGFYVAPDGNFYVVVGKTNKEENNDAVAMEIRKYGANWSLLGTAQINGGVVFSSRGVTVPFDSGNCRMAMNGSELVVHCAREMYKNKTDGLNHQSSLSLVINAQDMSWKVGPLGVYVSHSFNQFVRSNGSGYVWLDHGDAQPRALYMTVGTSKQVGANTRYELVKYQGALSANFTGATATGLEVGSGSYLVVGHSIPHGNAVAGVSGFDSSMIKNAYLIAVNRSTGASSYQWVTNFNPYGAGVSVGEPRLVRLSDNRFVMLFTVVKDGASSLEYRLIDGGGTILQQKSIPDAAFAPGSDPIVVGKRIHWAGKASNAKVYAYVLDVADEAEPRLVVPVSGMSLNRSKLSIDLSGTFALTANMQPANATFKSVAWSSSDPSIASVADGVVTPRALGEAVITAKSLDNASVSASCEVTVVGGATVSDIELSETALAIDLTGPVALNASVRPETAKDKTLNWSSSNPGVASVDAGLITPHACGVAVITAQSAENPAVSASCEVTVSSSMLGEGVQSVQLNRTKLDIGISDAFTLVPTVLPETAANKALTWTSGNPGVASVADGVITPHALGKALITARSVENPSASAICEVTVGSSPLNAELSIQLSKAKLTIGATGTANLTATVLPETAPNRAVSWSSDNPSVASVANGVVTPRAPGKAVVTAKAVADASVSASCEVTVGEPGAVSDIELSETRLSVGKSGTAALTARVLPETAANKAISWSSSNADVASVSNGVVSAHALGRALITARSVENPSVSAICEVTVGSPVRGVQLNGGVRVFSIKKGQKQQLPYAIDTSDHVGVRLVWESRNPKFVKVDQSGNVKGVKKGSAWVVASSADNPSLSDMCMVYVDTAVVPVQHIRMSAAEATTPGGMLKLKATVLPANATMKSLAWSSDNPAVVSVPDVTGSEPTLTALSPGTATIYCESVSNSAVVATCEVTVIPASSHVRPQSVALSAASLTLEAGDERALNAAVSPPTATLNSVLWESSNPYVASVGPDGTVYAHRAGQASVWAQTVDGKLRASCLVSVPGPAQVLDTAQNTVYLKKGQTVKLPVLAKSVDGAALKVRFESSDKSVVSVDKNGKLKAKKKGAAVITMSTADGKQSQLHAICGGRKPSVLLLTNAPLGQYMTVGNMFPLAAQALPEDAQGVLSFKSSNAKVLKVDALGVLTAVKPGKATVTVSIGGKKKTLKITVG